MMAKVHHGRIELLDNGSKSKGQEQEFLIQYDYCPLITSSFYKPRSICTNSKHWIDQTLCGFNAFQCKQIYRFASSTVVVLTYKSAGCCSPFSTIIQSNPIQSDISPTLFYGQYDSYRFLEKKQFLFLIKQARRFQKWDLLVYPFSLISQH